MQNKDKRKRMDINKLAYHIVKDATDKDSDNKEEDKSKTKSLKKGKPRD